MRYNEQYSFSFLNKVFRTIGLAIEAKKVGTAITAFFMCPQFALYALNPHFSGYTSRICAKTVEAESIHGVFFVSVAYILRFLDFFSVFPL